MSLSGMERFERGEVRTLRDFVLYKVAGHVWYPTRGWPELPWEWLIRREMEVSRLLAATSAECEEEAKKANDYLAAEYALKLVDYASASAPVGKMEDAVGDWVTGLTVEGTEQVGRDLIAWLNLYRKTVVHRPKEPEFYADGEDWRAKRLARAREGVRDLRKEIVDARKSVCRRAAMAHSLRRQFGISFEELEAAYVTGVE